MDGLPPHRAGPVGRATPPRAWSRSPTSCSPTCITLERRSRTLGYQPDELANGANGLLDEVASSKITGEEDRYSHTDLSDFVANVSGSQTTFGLLAPALRRPDRGAGDDDRPALRRGAGASSHRSARAARSRATPRSATPSASSSAASSTSWPSRSPESPASSGADLRVALLLLVCRGRGRAGAGRGSHVPRGCSTISPWTTARRRSPTTSRSPPACAPRPACWPPRRNAGDDPCRPHAARDPGSPASLAAVADGRALTARAGAAAPCRRPAPAATVDAVRSALAGAATACAPTPWARHRSRRALAAGGGATRGRVLVGAPPAPAC